MRQDGMCQGYVALLAVLIVGAVSTAIGVALLASGIDGQRSSLVGQRAYQARGLLSACAEEALQVVHDNPVYTGSGNLSMGQGSCTYAVTNTGGTSRTIVVTATVGSVINRAQITVTLGSSITVNTWQETS